jgi:trehalose 6-phosphate synthase
VDAADVVIASNRGPIGFRRSADGSITSSRGGGGLVSAMAGLGDAATTLWVCAALSDVDREVASAAPGGRLDRAGHADAGAVRMLPISAATLDGAYNAIANSTLWFVHHDMLDALPVFDDAWRRHWAAYVEYNSRFAVAVTSSAADGARVLVQDYHLALLPDLIRRHRPDLRIAHFTHTPWATPAGFATLPPDVGRDLLVGMLGADSLGFHSRRWARAFIDCCAVLGAGDLGDAVQYDGRLTAVRVHPLGVDAGPLLARAAEPDVADRRARLAAAVGDRQTVVRVDRTEPSKNIVRGLEAFRDLLVRYPEHRGTVIHVALAYPSRQDVATYRSYTEQVRSVAEGINADLGSETWTPVLLSIVDDFAQSLATLAIGDVVLVNPVRDGMNLVAKEASLLTDDAVLVLSTEAGVADEVEGAALLVDPFDVAATAEALHEALVMPSGERARRHRELVEAATALPPAQWLRQQLDALS